MQGSPRCIGILHRGGGARSDRSSHGLLTDGSNKFPSSLPAPGVCRGPFSFRPGEASPAFGIPLIAGADAGVMDENMLEALNVSACAACDMAARLQTELAFAHADLVATELAHVRGELRHPSRPFTGFHLRRIAAHHRRIAAIEALLAEFGCVHGSAGPGRLPADPIARTDHTTETDDLAA
ncbi:MAG TPA: hypothetical protein VK348_05910 [Planctomycetota bacterium]|nr:hypothetical protein [Planctomycetota bacterium]